MTWVFFFQDLTGTLPPYAESQPEWDTAVESMRSVITAMSPPSAKSLLMETRHYVRNTPMNITDGKLVFKMVLADA